MNNATFPVDCSILRTYSRTYSVQCALIHLIERYNFAIILNMHIYIVSAIQTLTAPYDLPERGEHADDAPRVRGKDAAQIPHVFTAFVTNVTLSNYSASRPCEGRFNDSACSSSTCGLPCLWSTAVRRPATTVRQQAQPSFCPVPAGHDRLESRLCFAACRHSTCPPVLE